MSKVDDLFEAGKLDEAISAATENVKAHPSDEGARAFLAELLCFKGEFERADKQLDALLNVNPDGRLAVTVARQLIRGATARREVFLSGRVPELLDAPPQHIQEALRALAALRAGDVAGGLQLTLEAEEGRGAVAGKRGDQVFEDFRDLDDVLGGVYEVLTSNGTYYWIPTNRIESLKVRAPERPFDLIWAPTRLTVRGGPDGEVYTPTTYVSGADVTDDLWLGRATNWTGDGETSPVRGEGLRMFLVGEDAVPILELGELEFDEGA